MVSQLPISSWLVWQEIVNFLSLSTSFLQVLLVPGQSGVNGPNATPLRSMARSSDFATASMLLRLLPAMVIQMRRLLAQSLPIQVALLFKAESIPFQGSTVCGKSGENGPTATSLARVPESSDTELARLPCSEATTVLATQLRRLHALMLAAAQALCRASEPWSLLINHLAETPPVQVGFNP